jgi:hypothetical protein
MPERDYKVKIITEATGDGAKKAADELKKLEGNARTVGAETERLTGNKKRLLDAFKRLSHEVPIVGSVVAALKNPYVALTAVLGIAIAKLQEFVESVEKMAKAARNFDTLNLSIRDFAEIIAANEADRSKFLRDLDAQANKTRDAAAHLKDLNAELEHRFDLEEKTAVAQKRIALAGVTDPAQRARIEAQFASEEEARDRRRAEARATALFNAGTRGRDLAASARAQLPGAEAELDAATIAQATLQRNAAAQQEFVQERFGGRKSLVEKIRQLEDQARLAGPNQTVRGLSEARAALDELDFAELQLNRGGRTARERVTVAQERVTALRGAVTAGDEGFRAFRGESAQAFRRAEDIRALVPIQQQATKAELDAAVQAELKAEADRLAKEIGSLLGEIRRSVRRQTQSD